MDILIEQLAPSVANLITEDTQDGRDVWLNGIFMQSNRKNQNGRVYPHAEITEAVNKANTIIKQSNGIMGELDHPSGLNINLDRVSHIITELKMTNDDAIGRAKLLKTPMGNIAAELVRSGVAMGVSSRGAGNVNESGAVSDFSFVTVDIVAQPSAPDAYPSAIYESLQAARNGEEILTLAESVRHDAAAQKYLRTEIMNWLKTDIFNKR